MAGEIYDLGVLLPVLRVQKVMTPFWLEMFKSQINFDTEEVIFDKVFGDGRGLAPLVTPNVQGRVIGRTGYETRAFKPAYVKPKHTLDYTQVLVRQPGEALGTGSMSNEARRNALIAQTLMTQKQLIQNRNNWLAAKALQDGMVYLEGEDYPLTLVDFQRHSELTSILTGAARWSEGTSDPLADLKQMRVLANDKSGARITKHIFGGEAWSMLCAQVDLKELMDTQIRSSQTAVTLISDGYEGQEYMGRIQGINGAGAIDVWVDTSKYIDPITNTEEYMLEQNTVVGVSDLAQGIRCFGAIKDKGALYQAMEMFPKMWEVPDPSVEYIMTQSAPLMVPKEPNATFSLKVV